MNIEYFNPEIAKSIGIIEATFLQMLYRIIQNNREMCVVEHNEQCSMVSLRDERMEKLY